jgi:hypothetical protein
MVEQRLRLEGLEQEIAGTRPHRFDRPVDIGESGHQDHRQVRQAAADFLQQGNAVHRQHAHVTDHQRHRMPGEQLQRLLAAAGRARPSARPVRGYRIRLRAARRRLRRPASAIPSPSILFLSQRTAAVVSIGRRSTNSDPSPGTELHLDAAAVGARDTERDRQTEAGTLPSGGEERLENARLRPRERFPAPVSRTPMRNCPSADFGRRVTCRPQRRPARRSRADSRGRRRALCGCR